MTMFPHNDKMSEPDTGRNKPMRAVLDAPVTADARQFKAFARPISDDTAQPGPMAAVLGKARKIADQLATSGDSVMTMFTQNDPLDSDAPPPREHSTMSAMFEVMRGHPPAEQDVPIAQKPLPQTTAARVSLISKSLKITGQLESTEDIRIEGEVEGDVRGASVSVANGAKVKGTVYGEAVELAGMVEGKIEAKKVVLTNTAHMAGDVLHQDITIQSGAHVDGRCLPTFARTESRPARPAVKSAAALREPIVSEKQRDAGMRG